MSDDTYKLKVYCSNCDFKGEVDIHKGTMVKHFPCPTCGNKSLERDYDPQKFIGDNDNGWDY